MKTKIFSVEYRVGAHQAHSQGSEALLRGMNDSPVDSKRGSPKRTEQVLGVPV